MGSLKAALLTDKLAILGEKKKNILDLTKIWTRMVMKSEQIRDLSDF